MEDNFFYNIGLASAMHQHESATGMHMSRPSWASLPPPSPSHPSGQSQSTGMCCMMYVWCMMCVSLQRTPYSHWLSALHTVMCMSQGCSSIRPTLSFPTVSTSLFSMFASPSWPCIWDHQYHLFRSHHMFLSLLSAHCLSSPLQEYSFYEGKIIIYFAHWYIPIVGNRTWLIVRIQ